MWWELYSEGSWEWSVVEAHTLRGVIAHYQPQRGKSTPAVGKSLAKVQRWRPCLQELCSRSRTWERSSGASECRTYLRPSNSKQESYKWHLLQTTRNMLPKWWWGGVEVPRTCGAASRSRKRRGGQPGASQQRLSICPGWGQTVEGCCAAALPVLNHSRLLLQSGICFSEKNN